MKKLILFLAILPVVAACTYEMLPQKASEPSEGTPVFTAYLGEAGDVDTKLYLDEQSRLHWNSYGDSISVFAPGVHSKYQVATLNYITTNSAQFFKQEGSDIESSANLEHFVAVYPYSEGNVLDPDGTVHLTVPEVQYSYYYSAGYNRTYSYNEYPMVAVTEDLDDYVLRFRATCGVLVVPITGTGILDKVVIKGNSGEALTGPATVDVTDPKAPVLTMDADAGTRVENFGLQGLELDGHSYYRVAFILPPVTFENGFTLEVYDIAGKVTEFKTEQTRTIQRAVINSMDAVEVHGAYVKPFADLEEMAEGLDTILDYMGWPGRLYSKPDDWGILSCLFCNDVEGADLWIPNSGYNWFDVCGELFRSDAYRNPYIRFRAPFEIIKSVLDFMVASTDLTGQEADSMRAQARVIRAYMYSIMAPQYQFGINVDPSAPCVPIIDSRESYVNLRRASVQEVYAAILEDLAVAIDQLGEERTSKKYINKSVALGLRARVNLTMGNYQQAYADATLASQDYNPASIEEVSVPSFMDISEHNWIWGVDMTEELAYNYRFATTSSWLRSFSAHSYSTACEVYSCISNLLYDRIPSSDVRKGWWVDEDLYSPLIEDMTWRDGSPIATAADDDKVPFIPYTNVKFGCNPVATEVNAEDMPLMRVEEMILIQAEALARMGQEDAARNLLDAFVCEFRDPEYSSVNSPRTLLDEIWFQRRIELWGEGFFMPDINRLQKPLVRFHDYEWHAISDAFTFNVPAGDNVLLLLIPNQFVSGYPDMVQNEYGQQPVIHQYGDLLDGVTD